MRGENTTLFYKIFMKRGHTMEKVFRPQFIQAFPCFAQVPLPAWSNNEIYVERFSPRLVMGEELEEETELLLLPVRIICSRYVSKSQKHTPSLLYNEREVTRYERRMKVSNTPSYYEKANLSHIPDLMKLAPEAAVSYRDDPASPQCFC
ncbi:hypothetical protein AV540_03355 [Brevibacillus parabrevis]|nr:hypothetical protein AV540_03355 [Brevibacillus parabrevis]